MKMLEQTRIIDGVALCARYAFGPNRLHLCGPDQNREVLDYLANNQSDTGLKNILQGFQTMFPYLKFIAQENQIRDPFDTKVVEAYWLGNSLLDNISKNTLWQYFKYDRRFPKLLGKNYSYLENKISHGARCHHSFHVLNIWKRTGHKKVEHTLESLQKCIISVGRLTRIDGPFLYLKARLLNLVSNRFVLEEVKEIKINRRLNDEGWLEDAKINDFITFHWDLPCDIISLKQANKLIHYTEESIKLANLTI